MPAAILALIVRTFDTDLLPSFVHGGLKMRLVRLVSKTLLCLRWDPWNQESYG